MASATDQQISALFGELKKTATNGQDEKSLDICDEILQLNPADDVALRCKVVTLIRLGQYADALAVMSSASNISDDVWAFENIYCHYRENQLEPAFQLLERVKAQQRETSDIALEYLEAQMLYAQDKYKESVEIYEALLKRTDRNDRLYEEIQVNLLAAKTGLAFSSPKDAASLEVTTTAADEDALKSQYELAYNAASLHIARSELDKARAQLEAARKLCQEKLMDADTPQEEIDEELAVIATQLAYAYQLEGRVDDAMEIYQSVLASSISDDAVKAVVFNNYAAAQQRKGGQDAAKKLKSAIKPETHSRLKRYQKRVIDKNEALLHLYMKKYAACREMAQRLIEKYPDNDSLYLIIAAATYQQHKAGKAVEELKEYSRKRPESLAIRFAAIQMQLLQSQPAAALETLESYVTEKSNPKASYKPALVALLVWLYEQTGQSGKAYEVLEKAAAYWKTDEDFSSIPRTSILKQTAALKLKMGQYEEAVSDFKELVEEDPADAHAIAGLILAYTEVDPAKAEPYVAALQTVAMDYLGVEHQQRRAMLAAQEESKQQRTKKPRTKKKRKPLLPKNYDPNKTPDPERWLPKRERTQTTKSKRK